MKHFAIATIAEQSADFRRVLWTGRHAQLVIMTIPPGGEIGEETHRTPTRFFPSSVVPVRPSWLITHQIAQGDLVAVPAGTRHNFRNTGVNPLVLYTVYGPPETRRRCRARHQGGSRRRRDIRPGRRCPGSRHQQQGPTTVRQRCAGADLAPQEQLAWYRQSERTLTARTDHLYVHMHQSQLPDGGGSDDLMATLDRVVAS